MKREDFVTAVLEWRNIEPDNVCVGCGGAGCRTYGSTTGYRGGIGGQMLTSGVCDKCWGSGDKTKVWPSHKHYK